MKCPHCSTLSPPPPPNAKQTRCAKCGHTFAVTQTLRSPPPPPPPRPPAPSSLPPSATLVSTPATKSHVYQTPFGKLSAKPQSAGGWTAIYEFARPGLSADRLKSIVAESWQKYTRFDSAQAAKLVSFDEVGPKVAWKFGAAEELVPLSSLALPLAPAVVESVVESLARCCEQLAARTLAIGDFHPARIFVDRRFQTIVVPSLWLAAEAAAAPSAVASMSCVAPEWSEGAASVDVSLAEVYGLGALAWLLLTGESRKVASGLPSDRSPSLAGWDAFVDGCCRTHAARRFATPAEAVAALKSPTPTSRSPSGGGPTQDRAKLPLGRSKAPWLSMSLRKFHRLLMMVAAVVVVAAFLGLSMVDKVQPFERGVADSIIRYADRDYSKCEWQLVEGTESIVKQLGSFGNGPPMQLKNVVGWDDDTFWVVGSAGDRNVPIVRFNEKHPARKAGPVADASGATVVRLLSKDKLLLAVRDKVYECSEEAKEMGEAAPGQSQVSEWSEICPIAEDNYYLFMQGYNPREICSHFFQGTRDEKTVDDSSHKAVVYRDDQPLRDFPTAGIKYTRTYTASYAVGLEVRRIGHRPWSTPKLVFYDKGAWYHIRDLPEPGTTVNAAWYSFSDGKVRSVFLAADGGNIYKHDVEGGNFNTGVMNADKSAETSFRLVQIWGSSERKYWVMDDNGTVWQVVDGKPKLLIAHIVSEKEKEKIKIRSSWVSPTGTVIAITDKEIWRLDDKTK